MTKKNLLEVQKQRLWLEVERRRGVHLPQDLRDRLESDPGIDEVDPRDREGVRQFLSDLRGVAEDFFERLRYLQDDRYLKGLFSCRTEAMPGTSHRHLV